MSLITERCVQLFRLACLRHLMGLIESEWPIGRQERDRRGCEAETNRRNENKEERMRDSPRASQATAK